MSPAILRFAPSPNGLLHLGHAYSALLNAAEAHRLGGHWLLRIEDIDPVRSRPEFEAAIRADLAWLGLAPQGPVLRQSTRLPAYADAADALRRTGLLFPCRCTRGDVAREVARREAQSGTPWPRDPDGAPLYPGTCRGQPAGGASESLSRNAEPALPKRPHAEAAAESGPRSKRNRHASSEASLRKAPQDGEIGDVRPGAGGRCAWRLDVEKALRLIDDPLCWRRFAPDRPDESIRADPAGWGCPILVRKDVPTSYHLAVVVDDAAQGVTHVVRGRDLEAATDLHALLQRLLGLPAPRYRHHDLILGQAGVKLSKSLGAPSLASLREAGVTPAEVRTRLGF